MANYTVKKLAKTAGVSVRTLHLYDKMGLLRPAIRTTAGYRLYGREELLRLQQILFYKELDMPLKEIQEILDDPDFDLLHALESHKAALQNRRDRLGTLLDTIDKTISNLKNEVTMQDNELYEGLPREQARAWRKEAVEKWGEEAVSRSENAMREMLREKGDGMKGKLHALKEEMNDVNLKLRQLKGHDPAAPEVQALMARHYAVIRQFWGTTDMADKQAEAYAGLGELYVNDERYTSHNGQPDADFARFMQKAMRHYADTELK